MGRRNEPEALTVLVIVQVDLVAKIAHRGRVSPIANTLFLIQKPLNLAELAPGSRVFL